MKFLATVLFAVLLLTNAPSMRAQQIDPSTPPPPPPAEAPPEPPPPAELVFDPLHAQKSIDVGTFYLKKGNYDAAIDRFIDATRFQPKLAIPWKLLGEAYEKKHDNGGAIDASKKNLEFFPNAVDAAKEKKQFALVEEKSGQEAFKRPPH